MMHDQYIVVFARRRIRVYLEDFIGHEDLLHACAENYMLNYFGIDNLERDTGASCND